MVQQRYHRHRNLRRIVAMAFLLGAVLITSSATVSQTAHAQPGALSAGGPYEGRVGDPIAMEGSLAVTPGSIVQWRWQFGDGGTALGQVVSHTYTQPGTYNVTLTVTLQDGEQRSASTTAQVTQAMMPGQLTVQADGPYGGQVGVPITFTAQVGLGGRPPGTVVEVTWNFGDGSTGVGQSAVHTYSAPGTYRVTVRASVGANQTAIDSTTATIVGQRNIGLSAGGPYVGQVAQNITMTGSVQDPAAQVAEWQWHFGDGTSATGRVVQKGYLVAGIYQVTLTAILADGEQFSATTTATISGSSQQFTASAGGPYSAAVNQPITMTASTNPPGVAVSEWLWTFGDGTTGSGQTVQKTYSATGTYTVSVEIRPFSGGSVTATTTATIAAQAQTEPVRLVTGCNNVALTWPVGTPLMSVTNAVAPPGVVQSLFTLDAAQGRFRGYSPSAPSFANDFTMVETPLQAVYVCVTAASTLNRPIP